MTNEESDLSDVDVINPAKGPESKQRLHDKMPKKKSRRQTKEKVKKNEGTEAIEVQKIEAKKSARRIFNKPSLRDDLRSGRFQKSQSLIGTFTMIVIG